MANFGLSKPWIASYKATDDSYEKAFQCGKAVSTAVTPNINEADLYADNMQVESVKEFKNASVTLGVDRLPANAAQALFGHDTDEDGTETSNANDSAPYVGYGFITAEMVDGIKKYRACILLKVQFAEGEESYETKGDNIVFNTPTLSGTAMSNNDGDWRVKSPYFATEAEANSWIKTRFNVAGE